jgi:uncharacterized membrane protein YfcA
MSPLQAAAVLAAGFVAGGMNAVVGAGTLVTFPALLAVGLPPVVANVSSSLGVLPGSVAGAYAYRHQLGPLRAFLRRAVVPVAVGSAAGALLLLLLPARVFGAVVPVLLVGAAVLVAVQPRVAARVAGRRPVTDEGAGEVDGDRGGVPARPGPAVLAVLLLASAYGGYFGAGVSVIYLAVLGVVLGGLQAANGAKNVLSTVTGVTSAVVFVLRAPVDWPVVVLLAVGSALGGLVGGSYGRRLPDVLLRAVIIVIALTAAVVQLLR